MSCAPDHLCTSSESDPNASLPSDYTFQMSDNGTATFFALFATVGLQSITATDSVNGTIIGTLNVAVL
jgi:hypothetical protein